VIFKIAVMEHGLAQTALLDEATTLVTADAGRVAGVDAEVNTVQVQLRESVVYK
jgi:hypothetical protein